MPVKKRSIDDDLRQLALIRQDCVLASLQVMLNIFFQFSKKWVGRAIGNETFYGDGLSFFGEESTSYWQQSQFSREGDLYFRKWWLFQYSTV